MRRPVFALLGLLTLLASASSSLLPAIAQKPSGRRVAVVVGVSQYLIPPEKTRGGFDSLRFAHSDAGKMAQRLKDMGWEVKLLQSFPGSKTSVATKQGIIEALKSVQTERDDTFFFYFSGHGIRVDGQDYLVPADGRFDNMTAKAPTAKWVPNKVTLLGFEKELKGAFAQIRASRRLVVVDACRSTPASGKAGDGPDRRPILSKLGEVVSVSDFGATSYAVMYSCRPGERSWEDADLHAGVYTNAWLRALDSGKVTNQDGEVSLEELNKQVRQIVEAWTTKNGKPMTPNMITEVEDAIILGNINSVPVYRARLVVSGAPEGATIMVDGQASGKTFDADLGAGGKKEFAVQVVAEGFNPGNYKIGLEAGKAITLDARLSAVGSVARGLDYSKMAFASNLAGHSQAVACLAYSKDGTLLASGSRDKSAALWDVAAGTVKLRLAGHENAVTAVAISPDAKILAIASNRTVELVDLATGALKNLNGHKRFVNALAFSPDGTTLATGDATGDIFLWDLATRRQRASLAGHKDNVRGLVFSIKGDLLASASDDETAAVWSMPTGKLVKTLKGHKGKVTSIAFSPDGDTIATGSQDTTVRLWNTLTGATVRILRGHAKEVRAVVFSPDGASLAGGAQSEPVILWDLSNGAIRANLEAATGTLCLAFSPDGTTLVGGSLDDRIILWKMP